MDQFSKLSFIIINISLFLSVFFAELCIFFAEANDLHFFPTVHSFYSPKKKKGEGMGLGQNIFSPTDPKGPYELFPSLCISHRRWPPASYIYLHWSNRNNLCLLVPLVD